MKNSNRHLLWIDLKKAFYSLLFYFLPTVFIACLNFVDLRSNTGFSMFDGLAVFFKGMRPFRLIDSHSVFDIPKLLFVYIFFIIFTILSYLDKERSYCNFNTTLRFVHRKKWMISKLSISILLVLAQLGLLYVCTGLLFGGLQVHTSELSQWVFHENLPNDFSPKLVQFLFFNVPIFLISITLVSLVFFFLVGFSATICGLLLLLVGSAYFDTPLLVGNLLMLYRTDLVDLSGISLFVPTVVHLLFSIFAVSLLVTCSNKWELFE